MHTRYRLHIILLLLAASLMGLLHSFQAGSAFLLPITSRNPILPGNETSNPLPSLEEFASSIRSGSPALAGVYVPYVLAFEVVQQPESSPAFVSTLANSVTQFRLASQFNTTGLLAHVDLAGSYFNQLQVGQVAALIYGTGVIKYYVIVAIRKYQALTPDSTDSQFIDLDNQRRLSAADLFYQTYGVGNSLVFQTCISTSEDPSWGRLFVMARPVGAPEPKLTDVAPLLTDILRNAGLAFSKR